MDENQPKSQDASVNDLLAALSGTEARRPLAPLRARVEMGSGSDSAVSNSAVSAESPSETDQREFADACRKLREVVPKPSPLVLAILSGLAIFWMAREHVKPITVLVLGVVLLFHEMGHLVGMRIFGYTDVRVFLVPFFGAATIGRKEGVPSTQTAIVALLGPLPGLIVGIGMLLLPLTRESPLARTTAIVLISLNGFNLLPVEPFDGGKVLSALLFSRHYLLEGYFLIATTFGLMIIGLAFSSTILYLLTVIAVVMAPARVEIAKRGAAVRKQWPEPPARLDTAPDGYLRELFSVAKVHLRGSSRSDDLAKAMVSIHNRASVAPARLLATTSLLAIYAIACTVTVVWVFGNWHFVYG